MLTYKTCSFVNYKDKLSESIVNWSMGKEKTLNVIAPPYCSPILFLKAIFRFIQLNKRILYITNEKEDNVQLLEILKRNTGFRDYCYVRNSFYSNNARLMICNYENVENLTVKYDLIIYDDINSFPMYNNLQIMDIIIRYLQETGKAICFSTEGIMNNTREVFVAARENNRPICEPRNIITRIDINKEMPYMIYDYMNFSVENNRKVVIYVPSDNERVYRLFSYISNFKNTLSKNIMYYIADESNEKIITNFDKIKKAILITNDYKERNICLDDTDIVVYFSDDMFFDYKKLVFFCGKAGRSEKLKASEVIFLANNETYDMDRAKNIIRHFNKEAWEMGLLNI